MIEADQIDEKIDQIVYEFKYTFYVYFLLPILLITFFVFLLVIAIIKKFSEDVFNQIDDLYDKIKLLSKQHSVAVKEEDLNEIEMLTSEED